MDNVVGGGGDAAASLLQVNRAIGSHAIRHDLG
jgi:hypothetical protein